MKGTYIGELEELVLLVVGVLYKDAYGVSVMDEIERQTDRRLNISAVHTVLKRLEEKGLLTSKMGDPTGERGGRRKRIFLLTATGKERWLKSTKYEISYSKRSRELLCSPK